MCFLLNLTKAGSKNEVQHQYILFPGFHDNDDHTDEDEDMDIDHFFALVSGGRGEAVINLTSEKRCRDGSVFYQGHTRDKANA